MTLYKLGRIVEVFTGSDGVVRSARVKMAHGELKRPVVNLAPVFYDGVSEIENKAGDVGATSDSVISTKQVDDMNFIFFRSSIWYKHLLTDEFSIIQFKCNGFIWLLKVEF